MDNPERIKRPQPERTKPNRNVLGALGQSDAMLGSLDAAQSPIDGGHPLGPGFSDPVQKSATYGNAGSDPFGLIDEGVRAASDLVDAHIRQGEETAKSLGKSAAGISLAQTDVSGLLTGLVRAYSDVASVWVDIVGSLAHRIDGTGAAKADPTQTQGLISTIGLSITSAGSVETGIEMFRPAMDVRPQPLVSTSVTPPAQITDVAFDAGQPGTAGKIRVTVPKGQTPGVYHGLLLSASDQTPVGVLTLRVLGQTPQEGPA
ncbi:hypothetical protein GV827_20460 [Sulfitobacter sp. JBTF-M27]|uniref:Uncharacterized protein n=1 Tax=Sulfitobacter sediminilitoris TaxID=2698830 RepID=A0A6P0CF03_9RHOB|nr:hypothetical protein [Sulfitobacter sediminilitoris]NEK24749.1 hypothetical protein [Sulfitobacter sediminilitoris]